MSQRTEHQEQWPSTQTSKGVQWKANDSTDDTESNDKSVTNLQGRCTRQRPIAVQSQNRKTCRNKHCMNLIDRGHHCKSLTNKGVLTACPTAAMQESQGEDDSGTRIPKAKTKRCQAHHQSEPTSAPSACQNVSDMRCLQGCIKTLDEPVSAPQYGVRGMSHKHHNIPDK